MAVILPLVRKQGRNRRMGSSDALPGTLATRQRQTLTGTAGQKQFTVQGGYSVVNSVALLDVYINGVYITEYTATDGTTFTLTDGLDSASDEVVVVPLYLNTVATTVAKDPFWANVICMMPMTTDFSDKSSRALTTSNVGSCTVDTADGSIGNGCLLAPANGYISVPLNAQFGSGDFTVEFFCKVQANQFNQYDGVISVESTLNADFALFTLTLYSSAFLSSNASSWNYWAAKDVGFVDNSAWNHWALERYGDTITIYRNGTATATATLASKESLVQKGPTTTLGKKSDRAVAPVTRMQYFRVTKGVARYKGNFTTPTAAFPTS